MHGVCRRVLQQGGRGVDSLGFGLGILVGEVVPAECYERHGSGQQESDGRAAQGSSATELCHAVSANATAADSAVVSADAVSPSTIRGCVFTHSAHRLVSFYINPPPTPTLTGKCNCTDKPRRGTWASPTECPTPTSTCRDPISRDAHPFK